MRWKTRKATTLIGAAEHKAALSFSHAIAANINGKVTDGLHIALADCVAYEGRVSCNVELFHNVGAMVLNRAGADKQEGRNFSARSSFGDKLQYFSFTHGQGIDFKFGFILIPLSCYNLGN